MDAIRMGSFSHEGLAAVDPEIAEAIEGEQRRQEGELNLIASENYTAVEVLWAQGTVLTNKYAEGLPGARYYGGCEYVDVVEELARERAKKLFGAEHANVQPHSGSQANTAIYFAALEPGDLVLSMNLSHGGHITHGLASNISGRMYRFAFYGVDRETETIDYDEVERLARKHRPKMILAGASSYPRVIDFERMAKIAEDVDALFMVDMAHIAGLVAAGVHPSPVPHADFVSTTTHKTLRGPRGGMVLCRSRHSRAVDKAMFPGIQGGPLMHVIAAKAVALNLAMTQEFAAYQRQIVKNSRALAEGLTSNGFRLVSGGTDNHLVLVDLSATGSLTGIRAQRLLGRAGIVANRNVIPFDKRGPEVTSGIRLGTPSITTRGMKEEQAREIAGLIADVLLERKAPEAVGARVRELCEAFPAYGFALT